MSKSTKHYLTTYAGKDARIIIINTVAPRSRHHFWNYQEIMINCLFYLNQLNDFRYNDYHKVRIANACLKKIGEKTIRNLESAGLMLSSGSCRLCRTCGLKNKKACKHPKERRYSLEATGIDCNNLTKNLFNKELEWYKNKKAPTYTGVLYGLLTKETDKEELIRNLDKQINSQDF